MNTVQSTPVRIARLPDAECIARLSHLLGYPDSDTASTQMRLQGLLASDTDFVWVAEGENLLVGWVHAFVARRLGSAAFVELGGLVVDDSARRKGVGRALVQQVREQASALDLALRVRCNEKRADSHAFYCDIGFTELKQQRVFSVHDN